MTATLEADRVRLSAEELVKLERRHSAAMRILRREDTTIEERWSLLAAVVCPRDPRLR